MKELIQDLAGPKLPPRSQETAVDLCYPILEGATLEIDHGHALQAALVRACPGIGLVSGLGVHTVRGLLGEVQGQLVLTAASEVRLRLPETDAHRLEALAGAPLEVAGHRIRLGEPRRQPLLPVSALWARTVTIHFREPALEAARSQLALRFGEAFPWGSFRIYRPRRIRIEGRQLLGFEMAVRGLEPEPSLLLQRQGFGGRRILGCGLFVPF
jgi:CRISPR-associated protein Cas6